MGQKVNPHGLRVGVIKNWDSRWFARDDAFGDTLVEDYNIRKYLKKKLYEAGVPRIEIERCPERIKISIRLLLTGLEVDWITNTSLPLTVSPISIAISPSEKVLTSHFPLSTSSLSQILLISVLLELPVKIIISPIHEFILIKSPY